MDDCNLCLIKSC